MATISYGPTKSREGLKHAGKNLQCNTNRVIRGVDRSLSKSRNRPVVKQVDHEQAMIESEFQRIKKHGDCAVVDGEIVWTLPKKSKSSTKRDRREEDYWRRNNVSKVTPISQKPVTGSSRGDGTTKDKRIMLGKNPYDSGLRSERAAPLGIEGRNVPVPEKVYQAERQAFKDAVKQYRELHSAD